MENHTLVFKTTRETSKKQQVEIMYSLWEQSWDWLGFFFDYLFLAAIYKSWGVFKVPTNHLSNILEAEDRAAIKGW